LDFSPSPRATDLAKRLEEFMDERVYPAEPVYASQRRELGPHAVPPVIEELKRDARERGLWNLFLPAESGLSVCEYALLAETTGRSIELAPEALNCSAPDTGNMELLHMFASNDQRERWLNPLLDGRIRSAFAMTEPAVASSDANNIATSIAEDDDEWVLNGHKWWISGVMDPRLAVMVVMGVTDPDGPRHARHSMVLVPIETPGVEVIRPLPVFGYQDREGHCELRLTDVRVPKACLLGERGGGFAMAQARLGPGRIHHCMRAIGMAQRALDLMCVRANSRVAFGKPLAEQGTVQADLAEAQMAIMQARMLTLYAAWLIDTVGTRQARTEIAAIKVVAPRVACQVIDAAIQLHGGAGVSDDTPLAAMYAHARSLRIADGPDAVHISTVAKQVLRPYREHL
jgi:acyl-CoA dehydrogenase